MNQVQIFMPPPANWQDFQGLIADVARAKYCSETVQEYGRQGQPQHGLDVYAVDFFDKKIGIQCKETKKKSLTVSTIDKEVNKAKSFQPTLDLFVIATTHRIDKKLQDHINQINASKTHPFLIQIWFWDDINQEVNRSQAVMSSCYRTFLEQFGKTEIENHLSAVRLAFERPAFADDFLFERNYDEFENALVATKAMLKTGFLYDRWGSNLILQTVPSSMIGDKKYQSFIVKIEAALEKVYQTYLRDKKKACKNPSQKDERAAEYNNLRRKVIRELNKKLSEYNLDEFVVYY